MPNLLQDIQSIMQKEGYSPEDVDRIQVLNPGVPISCSWDNFIAIADCEYNICEMSSTVPSAREGLVILFQDGFWLQQTWHGPYQRWQLMPPFGGHWGETLTRVLETEEEAYKRWGG